MKQTEQHMNRRRFFEQAACGAGVLAMGTAAARVGAAANPFAYDLGGLARTDPKLIGYEPVGRWTSPSPEPRRLTVGPADRVYLATKIGVEILEPDGSQRQSLNLPAPARAIAVAGDGAIYAALRDRIEVFDERGQHLASWAVPGKKSWLTGLCVGADDVFAADSGDRVVLRFDRAGKLLGRIGEKNPDRNVPGLIVPSPYLDVALGKDGLLRVNNTGRHCVELYTRNGELELSWGKPSTTLAGFCGCCNPVGITLLPDGRCVTCEKGLPRVKVYSAENQFQCVVAGPESFPENAKAGSARQFSDGSMGGLDAAVDSQGRVLVLDLVTGEVRVMRAKA